MEDARNAPFHETILEAMSTFPCAIFRWLYLYFCYLMHTQQPSMPRVMKPTSSQHTTHFGSIYHSLTSSSRSLLISCIKFIKVLLGICFVGLQVLELKKSTRVAAVYH